MSYFNLNLIASSDYKLIVHKYKVKLSLYLEGFQNNYSTQKHHSPQNHCYGYFLGVLNSPP